MPFDAAAARRVEVPFPPPFPPPSGLGGDSKTRLAAAARAGHHNNTVHRHTTILQCHSRDLLSCTVRGDERSRSPLPLPAAQQAEIQISATSLLSTTPYSKSHQATKPPASRVLSRPHDHGQRVFQERQTPNQWFEPWSASGTRRRCRARILCLALDTCLTAQYHACVMSS